MGVLFIINENTVSVINSWIRKVNGCFKASAGSNVVPKVTF
ncbi:hypothetical protein [Clostridium estertheticum]|nr:hypothetical protein [Clostridium estertheticum]